MSLTNCSSNCWDVIEAFRSSLPWVFCKQKEKLVLGKQMNIDCDNILPQLLGNIVFACLLSSMWEALPVVWQEEANRVIYQAMSSVTYVWLEHGSGPRLWTHPCIEQTICAVLKIRGAHSQVPSQVGLPGLQPQSKLCCHPFSREPSLATDKDPLNTWFVKPFSN